MKYAVVFFLLGLSQVYFAWMLGAWNRLLFWSGASFLWVGAAYAGLGPALLGKRTDGTLAMWARLWLLPYFLLTWTTWHVQRRLSREACCDEILPGLWLGRRAFPDEIPPGVDCIVDMTSEFSEPRAVKADRAYRCLPTLDAGVPDAEAFGALVRDTAGRGGGVYVHCAQGHGRSALLVCAVLMAKGLAAEAAAAEARVKAKRPRAGLNAAQKKILAHFPAKTAEDR